MRLMLAAFHMDGSRRSNAAAEARWNGCSQVASSAGGSLKSNGAVGDIGGNWLLVWATVAMAVPVSAVAVQRESVSVVLAVAVLAPGVLAVAAWVASVLSAAAAAVLATVVLAWAAPVLWRIE